MWPPIQSGTDVSSLWVGRACVCSAYTLSAHFFTVLLPTKSFPGRTSDCKLMNHFANPKHLVFGKESPSATLWIFSGIRLAHDYIQLSLCCYQPARAGSIERPERQAKTSST